MASAFPTAFAHHDAPTDSHRDHDSGGESSEDQDEAAIIPPSADSIRSASNPRSQCKWFQRLVQTWRASIVSKFHLTGNQFAVTRQQVDNGRVLKILYYVPSPRGPFPEHRGYIEFVGQWTGKDCVGTVAITQRKDSSQRAHFKIGGASEVDERGVSVARIPSRFEEFRRWCRTALVLQDLREGFDFLRTNFGDLIIKADLCGTLYFKGYLLKESTTEHSASATGKPLRFGYAFLDNLVKERSQIMGSMGESWAMLKIWEEILEHNPEYVGHLHDMLISAGFRYADVSLAPQMLSENAARKLRDYLLSDASKWFYSAKEKAENNLLYGTIQLMGREGVELPDDYWLLFERHQLLRTAEREQEMLFDRIELTTIPISGFTRQIIRLTRACLKNCRQTKDTTVRFVRGGRLSVNVLYVAEKKQFKIHEKWLQRDECLLELGLPTALTDSAALFHVMKTLFTEVLDRVPVELFRRDDDVTEAWYKRQELMCAELRLLEYTQINRYFSLENWDFGPDSLAVRWIADTTWVDTLDVMVELHRESSCSQMLWRDTSKDFEGLDMPCTSPTRRTSLTMGYPSETEEAPACRSVKISISRGLFVFEHLVPDTSYFAVMFNPTDAGFIVHSSNFCAPCRSGNLATSRRTSAAARPQHDALAVQLNHIAHSANRIESLDILEPRDWYETDLGDERTAVVGISKSADGESPRKKRRRTG